MQTSDFLQIRWWYEKYCGLYDIHIQLAWVWDLFPKLFTPWCCYIHVHVQRFEPLTLQRFMRFQKKGRTLLTNFQFKDPSPPQAPAQPSMFFTCSDYCSIRAKSHRKQNFAENIFINQAVSGLPHAAPYVICIWHNVLETILTTSNLRSTFAATIEVNKYNEVKKIINDMLYCC